MPRVKTEKYTKSDCKRWVYLRIRKFAPWTITEILYFGVDLYFYLVKLGKIKSINSFNGFKVNEKELEKVLEDFSEEEFQI